MRLRLVLASAAVLCLGLGATALAGKLVTGAGHTLKFTAGARPAKPRHSTVMHLASTDATTSGQRSADEPRTIEIDLPGFDVTARSVAVCRQAVLLYTHGAGCPPSSAVGFGTGIADARPADPTPVTAKLAVYYGEHDLGPDNKPVRGRPALLVEATAFGARYVYPFDILGHGRFVLGLGPSPAGGGVSPFEITHFDVILSKLISTPARCKHRFWRVSETYTFDFGARLTATDRIACTKR